MLLKLEYGDIEIETQEKYKTLRHRYALNAHRIVQQTERYHWGDARSLQEFDEATMALEMAYDGVIKLHFCNNGGKIAPKLYLIDVLE